MSVSRSGAEVPSHHPRRATVGVESRRRWLLPLALLSVMILAVGGFVGWRLVTAADSKPTCSGSADTIFVAAAPDQFPVLNTLAHQWDAGHPSYQGRCISAEVVPKEPSQVATALGPAWDVARDGTQPDVWVPDSSLWVDVAASRPDAAGMLTSRGTSLAASPVVLAVRKPVAQALGWPQKPLGWQDVLGAFANPDIWAKAGHPEWAALKAGMTDPTGSTPGLAAVLALLDQNATGTFSDQQLLGSIGLTQSLGATAADTSSFFQAQKAAGGQGADSAVAAFPALESEVAQHDVQDPATAMVPVYLPKNPIAANFPYTILNASWVDGTHRAAAEQLLRYLQRPAAQDALRKQALRAADQSVGSANLPTDEGFLTSVATPRKDPGPATLSQLVGQWSAMQRKSNVLVVLDTSGSMAEAVPGTSLNRLQVIQQTAIAGFAYMTNQTSMGLWDFSVKNGQTSEYRELVPYGPVGQPIGTTPRQRAMAEAAGRLQASGFTPLYDTIYASFHFMQSKWEPGGTNAVLILTDGANELQGGLTLPQLLDKLTHEEKADRPIPIISVAVGPEADAAPLQQVSQATGGRTFVERDPAAAAQTLVLAFSGRLH
jgi:Ca-activated chloride channel homolog